MLGRNLHLRVPSRCASKRGALPGPRISPAVHLSGFVFREMRLKVAFALQKRPVCEVPVSVMFRLCKQLPSARVRGCRSSLRRPRSTGAGGMQKVRSAVACWTWGDYGAVNGSSPHRRVEMPGLELPGVGQNRKFGAHVVHQGRLDIDDGEFRLSAQGCHGGAKGSDYGTVADARGG